ncbi:membrane-targeted effector domain-containing toxin [Pseudomonas putida]|uniref:membrane-targeted effector domain-containing toxin n=1 Tax=Pseudomonas putida TaxID=303 RepID=UPI0035BC192B
MEDGSQLLYIPGEDQALHLFANDRELYGWVLAQTRDRLDRARFLSHFPLASHAENDPDIGLHHLLDVMRKQWDAIDPPGLNTLATPLQQDAFTWLSDSARQRMLADAHFALRSNADLRKQRWISYLQSFGRVFGPLAVLGWPVALAATGAGLAETGLDIDQAINGHTTAERQSGFVAAILCAINTLFNASLLREAGLNVDGEMRLPETDEATALPEPEPGNATAGELLAWVPEAYAPSEPGKLLEALENNDILSSVPGDIRFQGVIMERGKHYAMVGDLTYQVRFIGELDTWAIIDPENPFSFTQTMPLRLDADGNWKIAERLRLNGGTPRFLLKAWGRLHPRPKLPALEPTPYEVPHAQATALREAANGDQDIALTYNAEPPYRLYRKLRDDLAADARQFFLNFEPRPRPQLPELPLAAPTSPFFRELYRHSEGLVVGESHVERGARQFLVSNMGQLHKAGVKVIYLEHFLTDFHQAELDLFNQTGTLPEALRQYVADLDALASQFEVTPYTLKKVLYAAHAQGVRAQAIDCLASYRQAWHEKPSSTIRQEMMNFFAHRVIAIDQASRGPSKWVALVGNSHANNFMGIAGLAEMEGAIGLRVEDIEVGQSGGIGVDPGHTFEEDGMAAWIKSDLRLQVPISRPWM